MSAKQKLINWLLGYDLEKLLRGKDESKELLIKLTVEKNSDLVKRYNFETKLKLGAFLENKRLRDLNDDLKLEKSILQTKLSSSNTVEIELHEKIIDLKNEIKKLKKINQEMSGKIKTRG
ncbi:MAG: hypothetical protein ACRCTS_01705 [Fusobacteriaceae bacterium]